MDDKNEAETVNARFVGDPADDFSGPSNISMFGQDFEKGEFVTLKDPAVIRKVRGHSHFEIEGEGEVRKTETDTDELAALAGGTGGLERLKEVAQAEGVEFEDDVTKPKLLKAIRAKRKADASND